MLGEDQLRVIQQARSDRIKLVPILGSGTSRPLGLPSWSELTAKLNPNHTPQNAQEESVTLQHVETDSGFARFNRKVVDLLTIPPDTTTLALQVLVQARPSTILTTNLDHAIEQSFEMSDRPLRPSRVFTGRTESEIRAFRLAKDGDVRLLKLHGSIERPDTWVLTAYQYRDMYWISDLVNRLLTEGELGIPLFIGFGMRDRELLTLIHGRAEKYGVSGYCITSAKEAHAPDFREELRRSSLEPIHYRHVSEIPKILQSIFQTKGPDVEKITTEARGASCVKLSASCLKVELDNPTLDVVPRIHRIIHDASDPSLVGFAVPETLSLISTLDDGETTKLIVASVLKGLAVFPEFLGAMAEEVTSERSYDVFRTCKRILAAVPAKCALTTFVIALVNYLATPVNTAVSAGVAEALYQKRLAISEALAQFAMHPTQKLPPPAIRIGDLEMCEYPLTRWHVGMLFPRLGESWLQKNPLRPVTLGSKGCPSLEEILFELSSRTRRTWRLPTVAEWSLFAFGNADAEVRTWPWGDQPPTRYIHAGLNFSGTKQSNAEPPPVGLFPNGRSRSGAWDLIGTVYEQVSIAADDRKWKIAGCGYTTVYGKRQTPSELKLIRDPGHGQNNLGIRPVVQVSEPA